MDNINTTGYTDGTNTANNNYNIIPSNIITMQNVSKPLTLIPIIDGKPQYNMRKIANPGDPDIDFGNEVTGVIEIPYAQSDYGTIGNNNNPFPNMGTGINYNFNNSAVKFPQTPNIGTNLYGFNQNFQNIENNLDPSYEAYKKNQQGELPYTVDANGIKINRDPNLSQQQEADQIKLTQQSSKGAPFVGAINPYGGWNMANTSTFLGASIQDGNTLGIIGSAGKLITEGLRNGFSGAAAMKRYNESHDEYLQKDALARQKQGEYWAGTYQEGGKVSRKNSGLLLTGNFLDGNDEHPMPNAEVEKGEYLQTPDGNTLEVIGKKHSEGGELVSVPENTKVISDYNKIGGELATYFKKNYNINVTAGSTFATVLDKYKHKIGLTDILDQESKIMSKIVDQDDVEFDSTRDINLQVLSKKANEIQGTKAPLEEKFNEFTNLVFLKQEENKEEDKNFEKQAGGTVDAESNGMMAALQQFAQANGQDPEQLLSQIESLSPEDQQNFFAQLQQQNQQQSPTETDSSNSGNIELIVQQYAQLTNQDPNEIIQQLQDLDDNALQQAVQSMVQAVQQSSTNDNNISQEQPQQESFQKGGKVRSKWISDKIKILMDEGRPQDQAAAIAYSMWNQKNKHQSGGLISSITKNRMNPEQFDAFMTDYKWLPDYQYRDLQSQAGRLSPILSQYDISVDDGELGTQSEQDFYAGQAQNRFRSVFPKTTAHYSSNVAGTQQGLQTALDSKLVSQKDLKDLGVKILDGKIAVGTMEGLSEKNANKITGLIQKRGEEKPQAFQQFMDKNFNDSKWYYRFPQLNTVQFKTDQEKTDYLKKGDFKLIEDSNGIPVYYSNKQGLYFTPKVEGQPDTPASPQSTPDAKTPNDIAPYKAPKSVGGVDLPMAVPDQYNLPPIYLPTSMRQVGSVQANRVFLSPEENLKELSKQSITAGNLITSNNPYTAGAGLANLQAQQNSSINQAIAQTNMANQQDERNVSNINEERIMKRDQTNLGLADKYERESIVGLNNYYDEWRNFIDNRNRQNVVNWNLQNEQNTFNAMNPNYKIGALGQIQQTNEPFVIYNKARNRKDGVLVVTTSLLDLLK